MSIGPGPSLSGAMIEWANTPNAGAADAMADVNGTGCVGGGGSGGGSGGGNGGNGGGGGNGGNGGGSSVCTAPGVSGSNSNSGSGDSFAYGAPPPGGGGPGGNNSNSNSSLQLQKQYSGNNGFSSTGDYFGQSQGQFVLFSLSGASTALCQPTSNTIMCVVLNTRIALYPTGCACAEELEVGDVLLSRDSSGEPVGEAVVKIAESVQACLAVETQNGKRLICTLTHEVVAIAAPGEKAARRRASELTLAYSLLLEDGTETAIESISAAGERKVLQISLAGPNHVYLTNGIWSHNKGIPVWPPPW